MKKYVNLITKTKAKAFTLIEMLIVLVIISVLLLLFVPNLAKQKEKVTQTGNSAVVKVVESQAELYNLNHEDTATLAKLVKSGDISSKQSKAYSDYYAQHPKETATVAN
ncbi:competence type IV pilus major pilin ComGC [Streptococcus sciuri]|uniref:Competence type IV pilus major pilin ComGC n=1 Tax=Streptococcus sciuri TaxID=2973939 RepID=A0ABT2F8N5_9STRE|nr:competence type IV pilus major pilin ComGC [Streptococcus sciuri]MCS4488799.1 competence type IV pilus major pilin ComGC [Streptococcus sciuri]